MLERGLVEMALLLTLHHNNHQHPALAARSTKCHKSRQNRTANVFVQQYFCYPTANAFFVSEQRFEKCVCLYFCGGVSRFYYVKTLARNAGVWKW